MIATKTIAAAVLALGTLVAAAPANAGGSSFSVTVQTGHPGYYAQNPYYAGHHWNGPRHHSAYTLSPPRVRQILRNHGYREIRFLDRRGTIYQARAERNGRDYRIVVSARTGAILERQHVSS